MPQNPEKKSRWRLPWSSTAQQKRMVSPSSTVFAGLVTETNHSYWGVDHPNILKACREAYFENATARTLINRLNDLIVNDGLTLQVNPSWRLMAKKYTAEEQQAIQNDIQDRFNAWASTHFVSLDGSSNFYIFQKQAHIMLLRDGEFFIFFHRDFEDERLLNPLQLQLVSSDALAYNGWTNDSVAAGHRMDHGVELNGKNEAVAYHFSFQDGSTKRIPTYAKDGRRLVLHVKRGDYIENSRGVPLLANCLATIGEMNQYNKYELKAASLAAEIPLFVTTTAENPTPSSPFAKLGKSKKNDVEEPSGTPIVAPRPSGMAIQALAPGQEVKVFNDSGKRPSSNIQQFMQMNKHALAASLGLPGSLLDLNMQKSYSAAQAELGIFERGRKGPIEEFSFFLNVVFQAFLYEEVHYNDLLLVGYSDLKTRHYWHTVVWHGDPMPHVDPVKSAKAAILRASVGHITHTEAARKYNGSLWGENVASLAVEMEQLRAIGLMPPLPAQEEEEVEDDEVEEEEVIDETSLA